MGLKRKFSLLIMSIVILLVATGCSDKNEGITELNISAAASLKEVMEEIDTEYKKENSNVDLLVNFGGSGSLQQQIEQGAPCDLFISAGIKQMDSLKEKGLLKEGTYKDLVNNELVLIAPKDSEITSIEDLSSDKVKHISMGEPKSVPAGKYADEVLENLKIKEQNINKLVFAKDVKEVLAWTKSGNADVGFVYYSDALNTEGIKIVQVIPKDLHSTITYPVAVTNSSKQFEEAKQFEEFLLGEKGQEIFEKYGYKSIK